MGLAVMRLLLGTALVLHGLGNAVLPLRGVDATGPGDWSIAVTLVYVLAIVWFVKGGLGLLGVRPLSGDITFTVAAGGVCSLIAQSLLGHADLWFGVVLSFALPILTATFVALAGEQSNAGHSPWRVAGDVIGVALFAWIAVSVTIWPFSRTWGAAPHEWVMTLPGDTPDRAPTFEILHGVTIDAPPSAVWPWLVQLGQDRAGFYSYERFERLFGADIHNVREIRPEWQTRHVGDRVFAAAPGSIYERPLGERPGWTVTHVDPNHALVLENWGAFVLLPDLNGRTRFLIRSQISNERIPAWAAALNFTAFELPHFIMQRRMMLNIKELAERG